MARRLNVRFLLAGISLMAGINTALADCWTVTDMKGVAASEANRFKLEKEGYSKTVFFVTTSTKSPSISVKGNLGSYDKGEFFSISPFSVMFFAPGVIEVMNIDAASSTAYMTSSRNGLGAFDRAAAFVGNASRGCKNI